MGAPTVEFLQTAIAALTQQRRFRLRQLEQLDAAEQEAVADAARAEVHLALRAAAQSVLNDIDVALHRIRHGNYGRCPGCGDAMSIELLSALPWAPLCARCQHKETRAGAVSA